MCNWFVKLSLCKSVHLDSEYTNYSIRSTVISTLDKEGIEARHIIKLSSHKSESTIKEYSTKCPENKRKEMFDSLTNATQPKTKKINNSPKVVSSTVTKPTSDLQVTGVNLNLPNFQLEERDGFDTIDDNLLTKIMTEHDKENLGGNSNKNNNKTSPAEVIIPATNAQE